MNMNEMICKAPFSSIHLDGHWQSQALATFPLRGCCCRCPAPKGVKSYHYRSNMRFKLDLHPWSFNISADVVERQGFSHWGWRQLFRGRLLNFGRVIFMWLMVSQMALATLPHLSSGPEVVLEISKSYKVGPYYRYKWGFLTPINGLKIGALKL